MNSNGSGEVNLTNYTPGNLPFAFKVAWSPDGSKLAFLVALSDYNEEIYTMNSDGSNQIALTHNGILTFSANWSPDSTNITFSGGFPGTAGVYTMNADSSNQTLLTNNIDAHAVWSPDGTKIAFDSGRDGNGEIYVMNSDGTNQTRLTTNSYEDTFPDWQPLVYQFSGFFQPVDNLPTLNLAKAGSAIPVKFSLGSNQGLFIFANGFPKSQPMNCDSAAVVDGIEQTASSVASTLSYDPVSNQYTYIWKTDKSWVNTCQQLVMQFSDGTIHRANFKFK